MNDLMALREGLVKRLPLLLIGLLIVGNAMFVAVAIFPHWRVYDQLSAEINTKQSVIQATQTADAESDDLTVYEAQIGRASTELAEVADTFLTSTQVDELFDQLYTYADANHVVITKLQTQQTVQTTEELPYETRLLRLQVDGEATQLMSFVIQIREATISSVMIDTLSLTKGRDAAMLTMDIRAYVSPLAQGRAFTEVMPLATLTPMEVDLASESTITPIVTPPAGSGELVVSTLPGSSVGVITPVDPLMGAVSSDITAVPIETAVLADCPNAPVPRFKVGDWIVVDFNDEGALRLLDRIDGGALFTPIQLYDNYVLKILAGPVCGEWNTANIWYWYVEYEGKRGWVGEGTETDRWLCPMDDPECANG